MKSKQDMHAGLIAEDPNAYEVALLDRLQYSLYSIDDIRKLLQREIVEDRLEGLRGFLAFTAAADRASSRPTAEFVTAANEALSLAAVWEYMTHFYEFPTDISNPAKVSRKLHRVGTTSFVLKVETASGEILALKVLKYRFCFKKSITDSTRSAEHPKIGFTRWQAGEKFILMSFIEGPTLAEFISEHPGDAYASCSQITENLCVALETAGRVHGDLNPNNIIVVAGSLTFELRLIDFGVNYLLREGIGDADTLARASLYLAPEVLEHPTSSVIADVYALGVIVLQLLSCCPQRDETGALNLAAEVVAHSENDTKPVIQTGQRAITPFDERFGRIAFDELLDNVQSESPGLGTLIDDMLEADPRLRDAAMRTDGNTFGNLRKRLALEYFLRNERVSEKNSSILIRIVSRFFALATGDPTGVFSDRINEVRAFEKFVAGRQYASRHRNLRYLANWSTIANLSHLVICLAAIYYIQKYSSMSTVETALPGLMICLSFSFVAVRYYQMIFADIDVRDLGIEARFVNRWMRFCTFYWPPAILIVYQFAPEYWSFATCYGTFVVGINNLLTWRLSSRAIRRLAAAHVRVSGSVQSWLDAYKGWHELMIVYSIGMLAIGILVLSGVLHDVAAYTTIILLINAKLWFYNCGRNATPIRNSLVRIFQRYRRLRLFEKSKEGSALGSPLA